MEAEKLKARNAEIQDLLERVERKSSTLQRENEKLRSSKIQTKPFAGSMTQRTLSTSGALTSRGERPSSLIKMNFKTQASGAKENEHEATKTQLTTSSSIFMEEPAKVSTDKSMDKHQTVVRSSLLSVTAPFRQK